MNLKRLDVRSGRQRRVWCSLCSSALGWAGAFLFQGSTLQAQGQHVVLKGDLAAPQATDMVSLQSAKKVTLAVHDSSIGYVVRTLGKLANRPVIFNGTDDVFAKRINIRIVNVGIKEAFDIALQGTGLVASVAEDGRTIVVQTPKRKSVEDSIRKADSVGTIRGRVIDAGTQRGISSAQIQVPGSLHSIVADSDGRFQISGIPVGDRVFTVRTLGYTTATKKVTVKAENNDELIFPLQFLPQNLAQVITTGAGDRKRLEVGNSSSLIKADSITQTTPLRDVSDLIKSRAPGAQVISSGGTAGAGSRIRIRGVAGLITNSDPILIVDGVRLDMSYSQRPAEASGSIGSSGMSSNQVSGASGVPAASRLNDIDPELIESIEVLKGPSAATLYGSDAANGVIVIKTKRGRPGPARWNFATTQGASSSKVKFPDSWMSWGSSPQWADPDRCTLGNAAIERCTIDSVTHFNPLNHKETSPLGSGYNSMYTSQLSGGSPHLQYFLGGTYKYDVGVLQMPKSEESRLLTYRSGAPLPDWAKRPNIASGTNLSLNLNSQVNQQFDARLTSIFVSQNRRDAVQGANSYIFRSMTTPGYRDTIGGGWGTAGPAADFLKRTSDASDRVSGGLQGNFRPSAMLGLSGLIGIDRTNREDETLLRQQDLVGLSGAQESERGRAHSQISSRNASLTSTVSLPLRTDLQSRSVVGVQFQRTDYNSMKVRAKNLELGSDVLNGGTVSTNEAGEIRNAMATLGWFADQSVSLREGLFITAAIRADAGSSFGREAHPMLYPKFNGSWLISQESFFPRTPYLTSLRFRGAFGQAGVQPGTNARFRSYYSGPTTSEGVAATGFFVSTLGNTLLVPERSIEYEAGFDLSLWNDRITLDITRYRKTTDDALVTRTLPPSFGHSSRQENIGKIRNSGLEILTTARPISGTIADWSTTVGYSKNSNKLMKLSANYRDIPGWMRLVEGYPVNGFWARPIVAYNDNDGNGILTANEVQLGDSLVYVGQAAPNAELSLHNSLALMNGRVTLSTGFNYQGGSTQANEAMYRQCSSGSCQAVADPTLSIEQQLFGVGSGFSGGGNYQQVMYDRVSWLRWSNLSLTLQGTPALARLFKSRNMSMSLMGRNLGLWSKYRGADPEVNTSNYGNLTSDGGAVPQTREWSVRINLNF